MANSSHNPLPRALLLTLAFCCSTGLLAQPEDLQIPDLTISDTLPINLDADSSEFDRLNNRLVFQGLRLSQGALGIAADDAEANQLDFDNSVWVFRGNVLIESGDTRAWADEATVRFESHRMAYAELRGGPARFEQRRVDSEALAEGRALTMQYDIQGASIRLIDDAWLTDGKNEVSGATISYDLAREYIVADSDPSGQVRMKIIPPEESRSSP
jgi:lipopolysaccharide export system protein LptA